MTGRGWFALLLVLASGAAAAQDALTAEEREAFDWLDRLDPLDTASLPYIRVTTGDWSQEKGRPPANEFFTGFLIADAGDAFTVRRVDLVRRTLEKSPPGTPEHERRGFEAADLAADARAFAATFASNGFPRFSDDARPDHTVPHRVLALLLARACARRGLDGAAHELCDVVRGAEDGGPPLAVLQKDLAQGWHWQTLLLLGDPAVPRSEILARCRKHLDVFPRPEPEPAGSRSVGTAANLSWDVTSLAEDLEAMIREGEACARGDRMPADSEEDREIQELIFALRDEILPPDPLQPGFCSYSFMSGAADDRSEMRPSRRLVAKGFAAIPRLIEALKDRRPSRCVVYSSRGRFLWPWPVFYLAHFILEEIAGYDVGFGRVAAAWWHRVQEHGEESVLRERVAMGDWQCVDAASRMHERFPAAAPEAISRGVRNAEHINVHRALIDVAAVDADAHIIPFLVSELRGSSDLRCRIAAAEGLLRRGSADAIPAIIREWRQWLAGSGPKSVRWWVDPLAERTGEAEDADRVFDRFVAFLVRSGKAAAVRALEESLAGRRTPGFVRGILEETGRFWSRGRLASEDPDAGEHAAFESAVEDLLARALDDATLHPGADIDGMMDPRICDLAAGRMSRWWPERYAFDDRAAEPRRDLAIAGIRNTWRRSRNLDPLPLPALPEVARLPDDAVGPRIAAVLECPSEERAGHATSLMRLGLGALPAVMELLGSLAPEHPARSELESEACQISGIVGRIETKPGPSLSAESLLQLAEFEGRPLEARPLLTFLLQTAASLPAGSRGVRLHAQRPGNGTGVALGVELVPGPPLGDPSPAWRVRAALTLAHERLHWTDTTGVAGRLPGPNGTVDARCSDFLRILAKTEEVLASPPATQFSIILELTLR